MYSSSLRYPVELVELTSLTNYVTKVHTRELHPTKDQTILNKQSVGISLDYLNRWEYTSIPSFYSFS